jgi:nitroreductase
MTVFEAVRARYSVRAYQDKPVEQEKLDRILEAARLAPSASNRQEGRFVVVRDPGKRARLVEAASGQGFVGQAPVVIVACAAARPAIRLTSPSPWNTSRFRPSRRVLARAGSAPSMRPPPKRSAESRRPTTCGSSS